MFAFLFAAIRARARMFNKHSRRTVEERQTMTTDGESSREAAGEVVPEHWAERTVGRNGGSLRYRGRACKRP